MPRLLCSRVVTRDLSLEPRGPKCPDDSAKLHRQKEHDRRKDDVIGGAKDQDADQPNHELHTDERSLVLLPHGASPRFLRARRDPRVSAIIASACFRRMAEP